MWKWWLNFALRWLIPEVYQREIVRRAKEDITYYLRVMINYPKYECRVDRTIHEVMRLFATINTGTLDFTTLQALKDEEQKLIDQTYAPPKQKLDLAATTVKVPVTVTKPKRKATSTVKRVK